jgi:hypothetical protein
LAKCRRSIIQNQTHAVARDLTAIQRLHDGRQSGGQLVGIGDIAGVDMMSQTEAVLSLAHVA